MQDREDRVAAVKSIRHFNRYYTNRLGLLARYRLDTAFTLTEARVLLEIGRRGAATQSALNAELKLDAGYLSRLIKRLIAADLVFAVKERPSGRASALELTEAGRTALEDIDRSSEAEVSALIAGLSEEETAALVHHFREAERIIEGRGGKAPLVEAVTGGPAVATARVLMREYAAFLGADLSFQGFEDELAGLPGKYAPPEGALFIASMPLVQGGAEPAGCVALRKTEDGICEMKRLFVRSEYRGYGIGRILADRVVEEARRLGYRRMRLDTLERLGDAVGLYRAMGFVPIEAYYDNPLPGAMFWELDLGTAERVGAAAPGTSPEGDAEGDAAGTARGEASPC